MKTGVVYGYAVTNCVARNLIKAGNGGRLSFQRVSRPDGSAGAQTMSAPGRACSACFFSIIWFIVRMESPPAIPYHVRLYSSGEKMYKRETVFISRKVEE